MTKRTILTSTHKKLGIRIKNIRNEYNKNQEELADDADIERSYMGKIERGEANPTLSVLEKIAKSLRISLSKLFDF